MSTVVIFLVNDVPTNITDVCSKLSFCYYDSSPSICSKQIHIVFIKMININTTRLFSNIMEFYAKVIQVRGFTSNNIIKKGFFVLVWSTVLKFRTQDGQKIYSKLHASNHVPLIESMIAIM